MVNGETTAAQGLHVTDDSAGYDAACKRVLSEKAILARIMTSCTGYIPEYCLLLLSASKSKG